MKKFLALLLCSTVILSACGKDDETTTDNEQSNVTQSQKAEVSSSKKQYIPDGKWKKVIGTPKLFQAQYDNLSAAQKYYFCSAFSMSAMSASKPVTASAMISYFLGVGVEKYSQGIDDNNYYAFDMGKNVLLYVNVVNYIIEKEICEKVITEATDFTKEKKIDTDEINKKGQYELKKIVDYISKEKK